MLEFRILGPVEALDSDAPLPLRGPKQRGLLALLLLGDGQAVSRSTLIDGLWGEQPPPRADHALDAQISSLRRALGPHAERLTRQAPGYALRVEPGELDRARFEQMLRTGRAATAPEQAAATLREALSEWRGPALADVLSEPFAASAARELEERRTEALEDRVEAELASGRGLELTSELERLTSEHPFRERLLGQRALALYRAGRQAEALETLAAARRRFASELGIALGPALRELEQRILEQAPDLTVRPPAPRRARRRRPIPVVLAAAALTVVVVAIAGEDRAQTVEGSTGPQLVTIDGRSGRLHRLPTTVTASALTTDRNGVWMTDPSSNELVRADRESGRRNAQLPCRPRPAPSSPATAQSGPLAR